ncbi:MAG: 2-oxoisovalerate dehydrogenase [Methylococcaceae bacterium]
MGEKCERNNIFLIEDASEGGFIAMALDVSIFTEADDINDLHHKVRDAVDCHFEPSNKPKIIRLHFVREEVIAA